MESFESRGGRAAVAGEEPRGGVTDGETRAAALARWGARLSAAVAEGRSVLQTDQVSRPPQTLPLRAKRQDGRPFNVRPNTFRGINSLVLRTVASERGLSDTRFLMVETAKRFNEGHGDQVENPVRSSAGRVMVPNGKGADDVYAERRPVGDSQQTELVYFADRRRDAGTREYFHVDDLRLPHRKDRTPVKESMRKAVLDDVVGAAEKAGLEVRRDADRPGAAVLSGDPDRGYALEVGPVDSFSSPDHHLSAVVHECGRFHLCRDGHDDSRAVAAAPVDQRGEMPELGRSDMVAAAIALDRVTEAGRAWKAPAYSPEVAERVRTVQAEHIATRDGLEQFGASATRGYRMTRGWSPTQGQSRDAGDEQPERAADAPDIEPAQAPSRAAGAAVRPAAGPDRSRDADDRSSRAAPAR